jgi:dinuclear metal center YbgI/SA1388 family protein
VANRDEIVGFLDELLNPAEFEDYGPNGLQVPGCADVDRVVTGVSAHLELFERAAERGAQLVLCHHGMLWEFHPRTIDAGMKRRLETLFAADMSLVAYHLPLDAHPEVGNNALLCAALGFERAEAFAVAKGSKIGWVGRSPEGVPFADLRGRIAELLDREPLVFDSGPERVHSIGVVSGGAPGNLADAAALGLDAYLTGEPAEHVMADAREAGVHFIAAGHYATETLGVRRLGELLAERFGVAHEFVEVPNPV